MSEWLTYSLSDLLLFAPDTYYRLFELYNLALWPAHLVPLALGVAILALLRRGGVREGRAVAAILAACWLWVAWAWFMERYATINWAASYFAAGFAVEALLLLWTGAVRGRLRFRAGPDAAGRIGAGMFLFALAAQPLIGPLLAGRAWTQAEIFGMAPDPTAVATLGVLLTAAGGAVGLMIVPLLWCAVGGATLWTMGAPDALVLPAAAALVLLLSAWKGLSRA
jgi:hypothetical protein